MPGFIAFTKDILKTYEEFVFYPMCTRTMIVLECSCNDVKEKLYHTSDWLKDNTLILNYLSISELQSFYEASKTAYQDYKNEFKVLHTITKEHYALEKEWHVFLGELEQLLLSRNR